MVHLVAAVALTAAIAGGIVGLGGRLGGRSLGDRAIRGWTVLWWSMALSAQLLSPRVAVIVGAAAALAGLGLFVLGTRRGDLRATLAGLAALVAGAPLWLLPPVFYDTLVYHLGLPWSWLANGSFAPVAHNLFSHFPLAASTVYLLPVGLGVPEAAAGLHWLAFLTALLVVTALARNLGAGRWSWLAALLLLGCWHAVWLGTVASADHLVVLGVVVALERVTGVSPPTPADRLTVGLSLGLTCAAKYTGFMPVFAVLIAAVVVWPLRAVVASGLVAVAASSFWWLRNLATVGNPVYPLLWRVLGGTGWTAADEARWSALVHEGGGGLMAIPHGVIHLVVPPDGLGWWFVIVLPLTLAALAVGGPQQRQRLAVATFGVVALLAWLVTSQTTRYALPLAAAAAALGVTGLTAASVRLRPWLAGASVVGVLAGIITLGGFLFGGLGVQRVWLGALSPEAWRHQVTVDDPLPEYRACDRLLPADARILVVAEGRPWGCPRPHHVSSPYDSQLVQSVVEASADARDAATRLREAGWTHLFINWAEATRLGNADYRVLHFQSSRGERIWHDLLAEFTTPVFRQGTVEVRALVPAPASRGGP